MLSRHSNNIFLVQCLTFHNNHKFHSWENAANPNAFLLCISGRVSWNRHIRNVARDLRINLCHLLHLPRFVSCMLISSQSQIIGRVNEYPTMHYFGLPRHTQSMIAYKTLSEYFWKFQWLIAWLLKCSIETQVLELRRSGIKFCCRYQPSPLAPSKSDQTA